MIKVKRIKDTKIYTTQSRKGGTLTLKIKGKITKKEAMLRKFLYSLYGKI